MIDSIARASDVPNESARAGFRLAGMLLHRLVFFAVVQATVALGYVAAGADAPWERSIAWWPLSATVTGIVSLLLLHRRLRMEHQTYADLLRIDRSSVGRDVRTTIGLVVAAVILALVPTLLLAALLWGDPAVGAQLFVRALPPAVAWVLLVAFPIAIASSELPVYFGYVLPRLRRHLGARWPAIVVTAAALSLQHVTLPLLFDWRFLIWRSCMFLPFAIMLGVALDRRPRLLPYLVVVHVLLDIGAATHVLLVSLP